MPARRGQPRPRTRQRVAAQTQGAEAAVGENENRVSPGTDNDDPGTSLDLGAGDALRTSTPVRLPPSSRRVRERKPIQRVDVLPTLPPSSPPFAASPRREGFVGVPAEPMVKEDPFGLLAAERRLKAKRDTKQTDKEKREPIKRFESESDDGAKIYDGRPPFATPPKPVEDSELEFELDLSTFVSGTHTPPGHTPDPRAATPRHHRPRQKKFPSTPPSQEDDLFPIPQTPSPTKRISTGLDPGSVPRQPFVDIAHLDNSPFKKSTTGITTSPSTKATAKGKGKKRGAKDGGGPARKKGKSDETLAEEELRGMTDELKELLPSRPKRRAAQRKSVNANVAPGSVARGGAAKKCAAKGKKKDRNEADVKPRTRGANANARGKRVKAIKEKDEKEGESFVLSGEEREKFEEGREERKEYFRDVDEYMLYEESVYII